MNFFGGRKLEVCFYARDLFTNELTGYVDLSDFDETSPEYSPDIIATDGMRLLRNLKYCPCDFPALYNNRNIFYSPSSN